LEGNVAGQEPGYNVWTHVGLFYETFGELKSVVLPFIKQGLEMGDRCVYLADEQSDDDWSLEFQAYGIDVEAHRRSGALFLWSGDQWRQPGQLNSVVKARQVWDVIEDGLASFNGVRFAADMGWTLEPRVSEDLLCHLEATLNPLLEGEDQVQVICQYNLRRHSPTTIYSVLRTHPTVILGGRIVSNPYYEAPLILENEPRLNYVEADTDMIAGLLSRLGEQPGLQ
jgi:hypothetical protein